MTDAVPIYLDHGATSYPKAPGVTAAMAAFLDRDGGNPGRGGHRLTVAASRAVEAARTRVATLFGADPERTLFGSSATYWINSVLWSWLDPGDCVVVSALEHNAVMRPLSHLADARGLEVAVAHGADPGGIPEADEVARLARERSARLVVLCHASNVTGAILPVADIAHAVAPVPVLVDGAQTAGAVAVDFPSLGAAAYACSGHKGLLGPPGTGVLLLADGIEVEPLIRGGTGSNSDSEEMPRALPDRLEAATPNGPGIAGLGAACGWIMERTVEQLHGQTDRVARRAADGLRELPQVRLWGWDDGHRTGVFSFSVERLDSGDLASWLDRERGLMLRAGLHCAPAAHRRLGTFPAGTVRAGFGPFTTDDDADALIAAVHDAATGGLR